MIIELLFNTPIELIVDGMRTCWKTQDKKDTVKNCVGPNDKKLIFNILKHGHESTLEHSLFTYRVSGFSRSLLQELARHRIGVSLSIESTRYTMKKVLCGQSDISSNLIYTGDNDLDELNKKHLIALKELINKKGLTNDVAKYSLVESYKVTGIVSFNLRSLRHFYKLRTSNRALKEIQTLAHGLVDALPEEYGFLFEDLK